MPTTDQFLQAAPQSTGLKIRTRELTVNGQAVENQVVELSDDAGNVDTGAGTVNGIARDGVDSGVTVPPSGSGIRGWLSGLYQLIQQGTALIQAIAQSGQVALQTSILASTSAGTTTRTTTTGLGKWRSALIYLIIQAAGTVGTSVQIILQGSADGGTTWQDIASFPVFTPATPTTNVGVIQLTEAGAPNTSPALAAPGVLAAGTIRPGAFGDRLRVVEVVVGAYTVAAQYSVQALFKS